MSRLIKIFKKLPWYFKIVSMVIVSVVAATIGKIIGFLGDGAAHVGSVGAEYIDRELDRVAEKERKEIQDAEDSRKNAHNSNPFRD